MQIENLSDLARYLPILLPILVLQWVLIIAALIDLSKRERTRGPKWVWILVILFVNIFGPIIYFVVGRKDE